MEFNWVLKLKNRDIPKYLKEGDLEKFSKEGKRIYPTSRPIFLSDESWNVLAAIQIVDYNYSENLQDYVPHTASFKGTYKVVKIYSGKQKEILTQTLRDLEKYTLKSS